MLFTFPDINHAILIVEMFILSMLARYAYRRPEPDSELAILCNGIPVTKREINAVDEANAFTVSVGYYKSCDKHVVSMEKENGEI